MLSTVHFRKVYRFIAIVICMSLVLQSTPAITAPHLYQEELTKNSTQQETGQSASPSGWSSVERGAELKPNVSSLSPNNLLNLERVIEQAHVRQETLYSTKPMAAQRVPVRTKPVSLAKGSYQNRVGRQPPTLPNGLTATEMAARTRTLPKAATLAADGAVLAVEQPLGTGWHLLSVPEEMADTDPASVLSSIEGSYSHAIAYDGCDVADPFKRFDPADSANSDLTAIDHKMGFWVEMTTADTLSTSGTEPTVTEIPLCIGWNLIGYPLSETQPIAGVLDSISGKYTRVFAWDPTDVVDPWAVNDAIVPTYANDLDVMEPGKGYWILATEPVTLTVADPSAPPIVEITTPTEGSEITTLATVTGRIIAGTTATWVLDYRLEGEEQWTTFATGDTSISNTVEATFDPTLLLNDLYEIRLTATDSFDQSEEATVDVMLGGEQKIGHFSISYVDLAVPVAGLPISLIRSYDSRDRRNSDFGHGWSLDIRSGTYRNNRKPGDGWIVRESDDFLSTPCSISEETKFHVTEIRFSDTEYYRFQLDVQMFGLSSVVGGGCDGQASFTQIDGLPGATLDILGNIDVHWDSGGDQLFDAVNPSELFEPENVQLNLRDGRIFDFNLTGGLSRISDPSGNTLTITDDGISHSSGKSVSFLRDADGRIAQITDPMENTIIYGYDVNGDLETYTDQESHTTRYIYHPDHYLKEIIDAREITSHKIEYEDGRMSALIDGVGNRIDFVHDISGREEIITDSRGNIIRANYDERGNILSQATTVTIEDEVVPVVTTYEYDGDLESAVTDPDGLRREASYDDDENLTQSVEDPTGLKLISHFTYNGNGRMQSQADPAGNVITYTYNSVGYLETFADPLHNQYHVDYNGLGRVSQRTDPLGNVTIMAYNANGYMTSEENFDAQGNLLRKREFTYDENGNRLTESLFRTVDGIPTTHTTTFGYNQINLLVSVTDPLGNVMRIEYDEIGLKTALIDARDNRTEFSYDNVGRLIRTDYADGTFETITYDENGNVGQRRDQDGDVTRYEYDELNRLVKTIMPGGATYETVYSPGGRVMAEIDAEENRIDFEYDAVGRLVKTLYPPIFDVTQGQMVRPEILQEYDDVGNFTAMVDALGNRTEYLYDRARRLTEIIFPGNVSQKQRYDNLSRVIEKEDEAGRITRFGYDALRRLRSVTLPAPTNGDTAPVTQFSYDEAGNQLTQTDALNRTTRFRYDSVGRMIEQVLPMGQVASYGYDAASNLTSYTDFNGSSTTLTYDEMNRLSRKNFPGGAFVAYTYTDSGRRSSVTDSRGTTNYLYDQRKRLTSVTQPNGDAIAYTYDRNNNLTSINSPAGSVTYTYNALSAIDEVSSLAGTATYRYDASGNLRNLITADGIVTELGFDVRQRLTSIAHRDSGGNTIASYLYQLSPTGLRERVTEADGSVVAYTYDDLNRLTNEIRSGSFAYDTSYEYDLVGNRTRMVQDVDETLYTYDDNDRIQTAGNLTFNYDDNGNTTRIGDGTSFTDYTYDIENRLTSATDDVTTTFTYDADGNRVAQSSPNRDVEYLVDQMNPTGYAQVLEERDGSGNLQANYTFGLDMLSMNREGTNSFYHHDGQASTRILTRNGSATDSYTYDAYGNTVDASGSTENVYGYTGEQFDSELGFEYLRARYYNPAIGRFISRDPFGGIQESPMTLHKYMYAHATPTNAIDPSGNLAIFTLIAKSIQLGMKVYNSSKKLRKLCQFRAFSQNVGTALMLIGAAQSFLKTSNNSLDVVSIFKKNSLDGQQITPKIQITIESPFAGSNAGLSTPPGTIKEIIFSSMWKYSNKSSIGIERWFDIQVDTFNSKTASTGFAFIPPSRFLETVEVNGSGVLLETKPRKVCMIEASKFVVKLDTKLTLSAGSTAVVVQWSMGDGLFALDFPLLKVKTD